MPAPAILERAAEPSEDSDSSPGHSLSVRLTHWLFTLMFLALVGSSLPILVAHPRFYWGETGGYGAHALFQLPLPLRPGHTGWARNIHFLAAWVALFTGLVYAAAGIFSGHIRRHLLPTQEQLRWRSLHQAAVSHLSLHRASFRHASGYNALQRIAYLTVVFLLFPVILLTGLAMSPAITSVFPQLVVLCGGHQSARTLHFLSSQLLVAFFILHVGMIALSGFLSRTVAMITGSSRIASARRTR